MPCTQPLHWKADGGVGSGGWGRQRQEAHDDVGPFQSGWPSTEPVGPATQVSLHESACLNCSGCGCHRGPHRQWCKLQLLSGVNRHEPALGIVSGLSQSFRYSWDVVALVFVAIFVWQSVPALVKISASCECRSTKNDSRRTALAILRRCRQRARRHPRHAPCPGIPGWLRSPHCQHILDSSLPCRLGGTPRC